ncbi:MAG: NADH-quinone oxidoreductase subunit M [Thermoplasmata archaeon]|nr:NADH-quinone oxidoreductase subunit M [Thermoplasmata archaeon]
MDVPILSLLILIPLVGALVTLFMGGERAGKAKFVAAVFSAITLVLAVYVMTVDDLSTLTENYTWIQVGALTMNIIFAIDGLSILMVFLTALLVLLAVVFSWGEEDRPNYYHALLLAMEVGLMGVYMAQDYFLFYIMWEVTLIPMYFMISWYGGPRRHYSAIKFFIYTHVASVIMLIGIFALVFSTTYGDFSFAAVSAAAAGAPLSEAMQTFIFGLLFFGFAVKMPVPPFHTWLPDAHVEAPTAGSVLLAGVMLKMGSYGIIRVCLDDNIFNLAMANWQMVIVVLGVIAMVYGAYACIAQNDLKKMVAYSSISHMGLVLVGIGCMSVIGTEFAIFQMFAHGIISGVLFMVCGFAGHSFGTRDMRLLGGLAGKFPMFALFMMFSFMASLGLPGLMGFVAEFGLLYGFWEFLSANGLEVLIVFGPLYMMLTAGYYLWAMQKTLFGKLTDKIDLEHSHDLAKYEVVAIAVLCVFMAVFGIMPSIATDFIMPYAGIIGGLF